MSHRRNLVTLLMAAVVLVATPLAAAVGAGTAWRSEAEPEWAGIPLDPAAIDAEMGALQKSLVARQADRAPDRELVVNLTGAERQRIDEPWPSEGRYLVGVNKPLGVAVDFSSRELKAGVWTASVQAPGATALRLHLSGVNLPESVELYVYNLAGQAFGPYSGRGPLGNGELWTNTVFGDRLMLQLVAPAGVERVAPLRLVETGVLGKRFLAPKYGPLGAFDANDLDALVKASNLCSYNATCVVNAACTSSSAVNAAKQAIAGMLFTSGGGQYICTGGLIADSDAATYIPYFLTANHCISRSSEAASLETYFDYTTTCSSPNCTQPYNNTGDTVGATIMSTNSSSDYCLLKLASTPVTKDGNIAFLGWSSTAIANTNNVPLYRISHPKGAPQAYSEQRVDTSKGTCRTLPRGSFIYSTDTLGATEGGSSGSPVVNGSGQIVGQLYGACGTNVNNVCDSAANATVDGAFAATYPSVSQWLAGGGGSCYPSGAVCTSNSQCCSNSCKGKPGAKTCK